MSQRPPGRASPCVSYKYTVSQKKCTNFETVQLKITRIDIDDIWQKYSKHARMLERFACNHVIVSQTATENNACMFLLLTLSDSVTRNVRHFW